MVFRTYIPACIFTVLVAISLISPSSVRASSYYYVSTTGNDSNPGTLAQPFRTIQNGVNKLAAGDTLYIRAGIYIERISIRNSGSPTAPITISSFPGETVIMDGNGLLSTPSTWTHLISVYGSYNIIENLELTYPKGRGILTYQTAMHNLFRNLSIHDMQGSAINNWGSFNTIEKNRIWKTVLSNDLTTYPGEDWPGVITTGDTTPDNANQSSYTTIKDNLVYDNYGEGILCMYTDNALIEGNTLFDNWAEDIYLANCSSSTVRNNLLYYTTDREYWRFADSSPASPAAGVLLSNENQITGWPIAHDNKIYNNIIINAGFGIFFWTGLAPGSALINDMIANNTIVNNYTYGFGIDLGLPNGSGVFHQNTIIENNLVSVLNTPLNSPSTEGLIYSHNIWSKSPAFLGSSDIVADPLLSDPTHIVDAATDPAWYTPTSSSPAIRKALVLSDVKNDYYNALRGPLPTIGAINVQPPPGFFNKHNPINGATNQPSNPTLRWDSSSNADSYDYCIDQIDDNTCNTNWISSGTALESTLSGLVPGIYYWQVRALNNTGSTYAGIDSTAWWFFIVPPLPGPHNKETPII